MCPAPPKYHVPVASDIAADDHRIHVDSDSAILDADGNAVLSGRVRVRQDARTVTSDSVNYDERTGRVAVKGGVDFEDPKLRVRSDAGHYDINGAASFDQANFQLMDRNGRGFAKDINVLPDGKVKLDQVRYTTCPVGNEDWMLQASSLHLDTKVQEGVARNVTMRFKEVPIFYTPYISFPVGDERKSGLLFPSFGHSGNNGFELQVPELRPHPDARRLVRARRAARRAVSLPHHELPRPGRCHPSAERCEGTQRPRLHTHQRHHGFQAGHAFRR
jgi:LPS-assembly protein